MKTIRILGIRGVPAAHGGFETFAEHLSLYLIDKGWDVIVYCQNSDGVNGFDDWSGVGRYNISIKNKGAFGTIVFDFISHLHAVKCSFFKKDICLTLGYNTAIFGIIFRVFNIYNIINMDGIEWKREKWSPLARLWFWINDWAGCFLGNKLIADHPEIYNHLITRVSGEKILTIPYGANKASKPDKKFITDINNPEKKFISLIARPEPENSILMIVETFSKKIRGVDLLILGEYAEGNEYHNAIKKIASNEVVFIGSVYNKKILNDIRSSSLAYVHGHQVGGTNPSLVEALGAGNAIIAIDNKFNRWVAGGGALYFKDEFELDACFDKIINSASIRENLSLNSLSEFNDRFTWDLILKSYENMLEEVLTSN